MFFDHLNHSLISLGQLCDDGCTVVLTKNDLIVYKHNEKILKGIQRKTGVGLRDITFPQNIDTCNTSKIS